MCTANRSWFPVFTSKGIAILLIICEFNRMLHIHFYPFQATLIDFEFQRTIVGVTIYILDEELITLATIYEEISFDLQLNRILITGINDIINDNTVAESEINKQFRGGFFP